MPDVVTIALSPAALFAAGLLAPLIHRSAKGAAGWILALAPLWVFVSFLGLAQRVAGGEVVRVAIDWVPTYDLRLGFLVDGLSLVFALAISGIGALVVVYSGAYLSDHPHRGRFLAFMLLFMAAMMGLVLADATPLLYCFWEMTSVASFLLIGFDHRRQSARRAAIQAFVVTNIGGLALIFAAVALRQIGHSWDLSALRGLGPLGDHPLYLLVLAPILVAAFTKSAQVPVHFWLPNAMEAPTPVSAFLHSATMVQAGVYLLARMSPILGGTAAWTSLLVVFGGVTLLWGAVAALRQTDLKQMLAQTTIASLGLLVLLIGIGTELAIEAMVLYFVAHALYKAGLFLAAGIIDHASGTRDITALGGLRDKMALTFIAAALGALSMVGVPPALGFLAKEEMYGQLGPGSISALLLLAVLVLANGLVGAIGLALAIRPFLGEQTPTPKSPHEGTLGLVAGPILMGLAGFGVAFGVGEFGHFVLAPAASAITGHAVASHLALKIDPLSAALWLSIVTWAIAGVAFWQLPRIRAALRRAETRFSWTFDKGFDAVMFGLIRMAAGVTRAWHHGRLELYVTVVFAMLALAVLSPFVASGTLPHAATPALGLPEWGIVGLGAVGVGAVLLAPNRLFSILALGVQGAATSIVFLLFGAPDLAFTQLMVEVLTVVVLALVMGHLRLDVGDRRPRDDLIRDGLLSVLAAGGVGMALFMVLAAPFNARLAEFYAKASVPDAHGHNIVNVILVDFRGLDTLGEISVVMCAGIAIMALLKGARPKDQARAASGTVAPGARAPRKRSRKGVSA